MLGECGILLGSNGLLNFLAAAPAAISNFLNTREGQVSAGVFAVVVLLLYIRKN
jgi:hypothetical protein